MAGDWWASAPVVAPAAPDVQTSDAAPGGAWWAAHDTVDAPSIPAPGPVAAPVEKPGLTINDAIRALAHGVPGGYLADKADAALNAALAPYVPSLHQQLPEETYSERYAHAKTYQDEANQRAEDAAPGTVTALKVAGGAAATAPFIAAAPAAFGLVGTTGQMVRNGALMNAALSGGDALTRGENPIPAAVTGGLAGAVMGPTAKFIGSRLAPVAAKATEAAAPEAGSDLVQAADRIGVQIPKYLATDSMPVQRIASGVKNIPIAGDKIVKSAQAVNEGLGDAARSVEQGFGTGSSEVAGGVAKDSLANWIGQDSKEVSNRLYGTVDKLVDNSVHSPLENTRAVIADIAARRQNALIPGRSKAVDLVLDAVQQPGGLNYRGIKDLRSFIGEKVDNKINLEGLSPHETSAIYAGLSRDLKAAVQAGGGQPALVAFERANKIHSMIADRRAALTKIIGVQGDAAPEAVYSRLTAMAGSTSTADIAKLATARKVMGPEAWNEVASAAVSRLGRDVQGNFSPERFLTAYGKLSTNGKNLLFNSTGKGDLARSLEDIATVSASVKDKITKFANHSGTAHGLIGAGMFTAVLHEPVTLLTSLLGGHVVADALSQPASAKAIAGFAKAYAGAIDNPSVGRAEMVQAASRNLANVLGSTVKNGDAKTFLSRLQGAIPVPADQETSDRRVGRHN